MYLDRIVETKKTEVQALSLNFNLTEAEEAIAALPPVRGFRKALMEGRKREMGLIAEVKKASPSKGLIRPDFDPVKIAQDYEAAGADCLSVLTDTAYFQGSGDYLRQVREAVQLPLLRKDFIIDDRQIYEARLLGADAVLLIAAILTGEQLLRFTHTAAALNLDVLIEIHNRTELETVSAAGLLNMPHTLLGINNRDLHTFATSLQTTADLLATIQGGVPVISESGISSPEDIAYLRETGASGVLVGEYFMRRENVGEAVHHLMGLPAADKEGSFHG